MGLENMIGRAAEMARERGVELTMVTEQAVVDVDENSDGKLDANPDTGEGTAPGFVVVTIAGVRLVEGAFAALPDQTEAAFCGVMVDVWKNRDVKQGGLFDASAKS